MRNHFSNLNQETVSIHTAVVAMENERVCVIRAKIRVHFKTGVRQRTRTEGAVFVRSEGRIAFMHAQECGLRVPKPSSE